MAAVHPTAVGFSRHERNQHLDSNPGQIGWNFNGARDNGKKNWEFQCLEQLTQAVQKEIKASLSEVHTNEVNLAKGRWTQLMKRRLETVPEHRRAIVAQLGDY